MRAVRRPATGERVPVQVPGPGPTPATGRAYSPDGRGACLALLLAALLVATPAAAIVAASAPQSVTVSDLALQLHGVTLVSRDSAAQELSRSTQASTLDVNTLVGPQMLCTGYAPGSGQVVPPSCDPAAVPGFISPGGILILSRELDTTEIRQTITNTDTDRVPRGNRAELPPAPATLRTIIVSERPSPFGTGTSCALPPASLNTISKLSSRGCRR